MPTTICPSRVTPVPMPRARRMAFGGGDHHVFGAVINNFHRFAGFPGQQRRVRRDHRGIFFLAAESAAGLRLNHANVFRGQREERYQRLLNVVGALKGTPHRHPVGGIRHGNHALSFDIQLFLRAGAVFAFDDEVGLRPGGIDVAFFHVV